MKIDSGRHCLRILCISPLFPPVADSEAFCAAKIVNALLQNGASVTVLSSNNIRKGVRHDRSPMWDSLREVIVDVPQLMQPNLLQSIVTASKFQTPFFARWVGTVFRVVKQLHRLSKFDVVYSRSLPMVAHIAGFWCARELKLPWIANINDPWELNFFSGAEFPKATAFETHALLFWLRKTLRNADLITYPCKGLQDFHTKLAKLDHTAEIIPHIGCRPEVINHKPNGEFRLVHAGKFGAGEVTKRSAKALLLGLRAFLDASADAGAHTKLVLVGPEDQETQSLICNLGLGGTVENVGIVNYQDSLKYISNASACILIESNMDESIFLPSKLADYLVCGKPVLALSPRLGMAADLASRGELVRIDHDPDAVRNAITALYLDFKRGTLSSRNPSDRVIAQFETHTVAEKFLTACQHLTSQLQTDGCARPLNRARTAGSRWSEVSDPDAYSDF